MQSANVAKVLLGTLDPASTHAATAHLLQLRNTQGFPIQLLLLSDDVANSSGLRQAALIALKNFVQDHCEDRCHIDEQDLATLLSQLLPALIRNVTEGKLTPTYRQIIVQLARKYYPLRWPQIVDSAVELLHSSCELNSLLGAVEALRAVFSVFGNAVLGEIELSNLCNRTVLPLLTLASKLFQNFNAETGLILVSIFKLVGSAISFHLASVVKLNLHSLLMFVKKVLDLRAPLADPALPSLFLLKKTALRILFRLFQKHANPLFSPDPAFPPAFHAKYTRALVETLLLQVLPDPDPLPLAAHRQLELGRLALSCLAYANRQDSQAALLLAAHRIPFLQLCLTRFRLDFSRSFSGFPDFKLYVHENRAQLKEFLFSLLRSEALPDAQGEAVSSLLGLLCDCLQRPDPAMREVALYLFAEMSTEVDFLPRAIDEQLIQLIVTFAGPLLRGEQPTLVRARACQLLASYCELELPGECLLELAEGVYACLLTEGGDSEVFLRIYACNAFNSLLKYPSIVEFVRPHLPNILQLYTALLEADLSVLRNFEDLLNLLEEEVAPFANHLLRLLLRLFRTYAHREGQQSYSACGVEVDEEDEQEGEEEEEEQQTNVAKAVVSAVRQILQADATKLDSDVRQDLFEAVAAIFANPQQLFLEEGFNILNLLLYKQQEKIDPAHFLYFRAICWAVLGLPPSCLPSLASRHDPNSQLHLAILQNLCVEPDEDLLDNSVGCLRNFLSKSSSQVLRSCDQFGVSPLEYIFRLVEFVHENRSGKCSETDRLVVLTLYLTFVEHQLLGEEELAQLVQQVGRWMSMEQEAQGQQGRLVYTPVYLQLLLLAVHFYPQSPLDAETLALQVATHQQLFRCDYELERVLVGVSDLLARSLLTPNSAASLLSVLPELVRRACQLRTEGDRPDNDADMDECEEERLCGPDDDTLVQPWPQAKATAKDLQLGEGEEQDREWEEEFNKYYLSPLDSIEELHYLQNGLGSCSYLGLMGQQDQQQLALYFANAPPKHPQ